VIFAHAIIYTRTIQEKLRIREIPEENSGISRKGRSNLVRSVQLFPVRERGKQIASDKACLRELFLIAGDSERSPSAARTIAAAVSGRLHIAERARFVAGQVDNRR